ncbi:hypothetical protein HDU86_001838 [Geranomyces michiganensis]|nr:hypothetical protein HDU86_001838 [Geranomyces michiganensis]
MTTRRTLHADSWYSASAKKLAGELDTWLSAVPAKLSPDETPLPIPTCRAIISPHAGYAYSGPTAAWAYKCVDVQKIKRVFILGPSHHYYLENCALSQCTRYGTPLGDFTLDEKGEFTSLCLNAVPTRLSDKDYNFSVIAELAKSGQFATMEVEQDEDEHSIEMQLPFLYHIFKAADCAPPSLVPILVGSASTSTEAKFGALLAPYLADPSNLFVISSDFCHYGTLFGFTSLPSVAGDGEKEAPIHKRIEALDKQGMAEIESLDHKRFASYLKKTKNTICGRHPIGVLLAALEKLETTGAKIKFVRYAQSTQAQSVRDSSVSYASAYLSLSV